MSKSTDLLNKLLISPVPEIVDLGQKALEFTRLLESKEISVPEYYELMDDLAGLRHIKNSMVSLEVWREINDAVEILVKLKTITSIL